MFKFERLPKDVKNKIASIEFVKGENFMGYVNLKDNFVFEWDESHIDTFNNRTELIKIVRFNTLEVK